MKSANGTAVKIISEILIAANAGKIPTREILMIHLEFHIFGDENKGKISSMFGAPTSISPVGTRLFAINMMTSLVQFLNSTSVVLMIQNPKQFYQNNKENLFYDSKNLRSMSRADYDELFDSNSNNICHASLCTKPKNSSRSSKNSNRTSNVSSCTSNNSSRNRSFNSNISRTSSRAFDTLVTSFQSRLALVQDPVFRKQVQLMFDEAHSDARRSEMLEVNEIVDLEPLEVNEIVDLEPSNEIVDSEPSNEIVDSEPPLEVNEIVDFEPPNESIYDIANVSFIYSNDPPQDMINDLVDTSLISLNKTLQDLQNDIDGMAPDFQGVLIENRSINDAVEMELVPLADPLDAESSLENFSIEAFFCDFNEPNRFCETSSGLMNINNATLNIVGLPLDGLRKLFSKEPKTKSLYVSKQE